MIFLTSNFLKFLGLGWLKPYSFYFSELPGNQKISYSPTANYNALDILDVYKNVQFPFESCQVLGITDFCGNEFHNVWKRISFYQFWTSHILISLNVPLFLCYGTARSFLYTFSTLFIILYCGFMFPLTTFLWKIIPRFSISHHMNVFLGPWSFLLVLPSNSAISFLRLGWQYYI